MAQTKKRTITSTDEQWNKLKHLSVLVLGVENCSGMISYMTNEFHKQLPKK